MMSEATDTKTNFKFLVSQLVVKRIKPDTNMLLAHNSTFRKGAHAPYKLTRVELKTFSFSAGSKSLSIENAVLGPIHKRLLFTMVKNGDFIGLLDTNPHKFNHYYITDFSLFMKGKHFANEGLFLGVDQEHTSVMVYRTLFEGSCIYHSKSELQITHDMFINGYFMLHFDLTPDQGASDSHTYRPENGNIRVELKFGRTLPEAVTCLLYLEFYNSVLIVFARDVTTNF